MPDLLDRQLRALHRHRRFQRVLDAFVPVLAIAVGIAAVAVMTIRLGIPAGAWLVVPLAIASVLLPCVFIPRAWARTDNDVVLAGHLDIITKGQGLGMALAAEPSAERDEDWLARLRKPLESFQLPPLQFKQARGVGLAMMCLLVAWFLPQREFAPTIPSIVTTFFEPVKERLQKLEEAGIIPPVDVEQHQQDLKRLSDHVVDQGMDQSTWEGLDRLNSKMDRQVERSVQRLAQAMGLAEAMSQPSSNGERAAQDHRLAQAVAELATAAPGLVPRIPKDADGQALSQALQQAVEAGALTEQQAAAVKQLGLVHPGQGQKPLDDVGMKALRARLASELKEARERLAAMGLDGGFDDAFGRDGQGDGPGDGPGRGGVSRGPGHAPLGWDDPLRTKGGGIEGLPSGMQLNPDGSVTIAEQVRDAEIDPEIQAAAQRAAARAFDPTAADAKRATIAPRHRAVVEKYFAQE